MNDSAVPATGLEANQRYLCAEFARIRALFERLTSDADTDGSLEAANREVIAARNALSIEAPIDLLSGIFGLTAFERDILLLASGAELDSAVANACAAAVGRADCPTATFSIALALLPDAHWSALLPERPLRRWRLLEVDAGLSLTRAPLRVDERILHFITGLNVLDTRLTPMVRSIESPGISAASHRGAGARIAADLGQRGPWPAVQLVGEDEDSQHDVAAIAGRDLGWMVFAIRAEDIPAANADRAAFTTLWTREAALLDAALLIEASASICGPVAAAAATEIDGPVFVCAREPLPLDRNARVYHVAPPTSHEQRELWQALLATPAAECIETIERLSTQARLSARSIARLAPEVLAGCDARTVLRAGTRLRSRSALAEFAGRVEPIATWHDLVVPCSTRALLEEIAAHVRYRRTVFEDWGFGSRTARGLGIAALFVGDSGTGKTMAAEVLANELGLDLYRIDLATVISKYIGETEKNLRRVFDAAEDSGAILFFDEADALFGKRSEVKDSHDRYANIEVSYLLQRMEAYRGLAILSTNIKTALDRAFQRRLRFIVPFPFPDAAQRTEIWRKAFPAETPTADLDYDRLGRLCVSGGTIVNIALGAAFRAARAQQPVAMSHVIEAARSEYEKLDRSWSDAELRARA